MLNIKNILGFISSREAKDSSWEEANAIRRNILKLWVWSAIWALLSPTIAFWNFVTPDVKPMETLKNVLDKYTILDFGKINRYEFERIPKFQKLVILTDMPNHFIYEDFT